VVGSTSDAAAAAGTAATAAITSGASGESAAAAGAAASAAIASGASAAEAAAAAAVASAAIAAGATPAQAAAAAAAATPISPPGPYAGCPSLEAQAEALCPAGSKHQDCVDDVGISCDLAAGVAAASAAPPPGMGAPPPAPTSDPTASPGVPAAPTEAPASQPTAPLTASAAAAPRCTGATCALLQACGTAPATRALLSCSSSGDPHERMFAPGARAHPQGRGPFVLAQDFAQTFVVQTCAANAGGAASSFNSAAAIKSPYGVMKFVGGKWVSPPGSEGICGANTCVFPTGERVSMQGGAVSVALPATYCADVQGLCGNFNPDAGFADAFSDRLRAVVDLSGQSHHRSKQWGQYQSEFVESFAVPPSLSLFTEGECPTTSSPQPPPATAPVPFGACPTLEAEAEALCPAGDRHGDCVADVGVTCELAAWVAAAREPVTPSDWDTGGGGALTPITDPGGAAFTTCSAMAADASSKMTCSSSGDPHMHMFSGKGGSPMGSGPYVLAKNAAASFVVQACLQPRAGNAQVSTNTGAAVRFWHGGRVHTVKHLGGAGWSAPPPGSGATCSGSTCTFASGESVAMSGTHIWVSLPSTYCGAGAVTGLCGSFNPDAGFADAYTLAGGAVLAFAGQPMLLGGPYYGGYQSDFVQGFAAEGQASLFAEAECAAAPGWTAPRSPAPPFRDCPALKDTALALCPAVHDTSFNDCVMDVGMTCDLVTWVADAAVTAPPEFDAGVVVGGFTAAPTPSGYTPPTDARRRRTAYARRRRRYDRRRRQAYPVAPPGSYRDGYTTRACPAGKFQAEASQAECDACETCAAGHFRAGCGGYGRGACESCPAGQYKAPHYAGSYAVPCRECELGRYAGAAAAGDCADCGAGQFARKGHTVCFRCAPGEYAPAEGADGCVKCAPGSWHADTGRAKCDHCPAGKFQQLEGRYFCTECALNHHQPGTGTTACLPCPYCEVTDGEGAAQCRSNKRHCKVSAWTTWGPCSTSCHEGTNTRSRSVLEQPLCGGDDCPRTTEHTMCFERACDCAKVVCKFERHNCTAYYDAVDGRALATNKMVGSAFRAHRATADSEYSSAPTLGEFIMGGLGIGSHDGSAAEGADSHSGFHFCHGKTSVRVYHNSKERYFMPKGGAKRRQEGHHCRMQGGAASACTCRCHKTFRHGYNPKGAGAAAFDMQCGVLHGLECGE
jgi:hypothetical protein